MAMSAAGMLAKIKGAMPAPIQTSDPVAAAAYTEAAMLAMCQGIINEIVANSELVPLTTDQGSAGAGIITGKVK